jgi:predicted small integral membrane protein
MKHVARNKTPAGMAFRGGYAAMNDTPSAKSLSAAKAARLSKTLLLASMALYFTLVVLNNTTDFDSNFQFVRHVLSMDSTFPGNQVLWRALHAPAIHLGFYLGIISWELLNSVLCWMGTIALLRARNSSPEIFAKAKRTGTLALTAGLLLWLVPFISIGGEWFLMWQSKIWNGQEAAFRMFTIEALILGLLLQPEPTIEI